MMYQDLHGEPKEKHFGIWRGGHSIQFKDSQEQQEFCELFQVQQPLMMSKNHICFIQKKDLD